MTPTFEEAVEIIRALPPNERKKLREILDEEEKSELSEDEKFRLALKWADEHRQEFDGKWVILDGDKLISSGTNAKEVYDEARAKGIKVPF